ncbi:MFS transporter [Galactobacter caseinivorans]|uniref:MFS transporter n=1 Tax=Galactobacter caseinivorans TaxID=2676123 RepID=A0A496PIZ6_9MICC|nr:MFS transporter [Galactobacter caseinivorans]RKW70418.1 MFS transporter [Galactobacter caseinivorans]
MSNQPASATNSPRYSLLALALGAFGIGMTEFVPIGLLPQIAEHFSVSIPAAGWVVSVYALGVLVGVPIMTVVGSRLNRRTMLAGLMVLYAVGNLVTALAPSFGFLLGGRVLASFTHGAFFGIGAIVAAQLVGPAQRSGAIAMMFTGLTLANLVGVPAGAWIGAVAGWQATFAVMVALGLLAAGALWVLIPRLAPPAGFSFKGELRSAARPQVIMAMLVTLLGFGGVFAAITYLAPMLHAEAGVSESGMTLMLALLGVGMVVGNSLGGRLADRHQIATAVAGLLGLILALGSLAFTMHSYWAAAVSVLLIGGFGFLIVPPLQARVLDQAAAAPTLASALNIGAFNIGNAVAAWAAGATLSLGWGYASAAWVGVGLSALGLVVLLVSVASKRGAAPEPEPAVAAGQELRTA